MSDKNTQADKGAAAAEDNPQPKDEASTSPEAPIGKAADEVPALVVTQGGGGMGLAVVSLLLAAGVGVGAYLFWQENGAEHQRFAQRMDQIDKAVVPFANVGTRLSTLQSRLSRLESALPADLSSRLKSLDEAVAALKAELAARTPQAVDLGPVEQRIAAIESSVKALESRAGSWLERSEWQAQQATLRKGIDELDGRVAALGQTVEALRSRQGGETQRLVVAEGAYLLRIARDALSLRQDVPTARQALDRAGAVLEPVPAAAELRQSIATALSGLAAVEVPDVAGLAAGLEGLVREIPGLPQPGTRAERHAGEGALNRGAVDSIKAFFGAIWDSIRSLVTVRRSGSEDAPLRSPEQQQFLADNVQIKIETARLALLRGDPAVYKASLEAAREMLGRYFMADDAAVAKVMAELERLAGLTIRPELPDLGPLVESVERLQASESLAWMGREMRWPS